MPSLGPSTRTFVLSSLIAILAASGSAHAQGTTQAPPPPPDATAPSSVPPVSRFDPAIFQQPIPAAQLAPLNQFAGQPSGKVFRDRHFRKLVQGAIPNCVFHYGRDMDLMDALYMVIDGSKVPVQIRDGRYLILSGQQGPYLMGRGFLWIDLQQGIVLGAFYFHPTNGEPTPTLAVFSRQVKERTLRMSQLPPAFAADLANWSQEFRVPPLTTRYFLNGLKKRILLEHDEDYCAAGTAVAATIPPVPPACQESNAIAADIDMNAASYLQQVNYATNATAWMMNSWVDVNWIELRNRTCRALPDTLGCRVRMTRQRIDMILNPTPHIASR